MADCCRLACLLVLASLGGLVHRPAFSGDIPTPAREGQPREDAQVSSVAWSTFNLAIRADHQYADLQQNRLVAEGNVRLRLAGGDLAAERITYERDTGLLTAVGAVRFQRGSQYIQASTLQYNLETRQGEMGDVYGVVNLDHHTADLDLSRWQGQPTSQPEAAARDAPWAEMPPMACPPPQPPGEPNRPEGGVHLERPSLAPPLGCPNPDGHAQRVQGITAQSSLQLEYRLALTDRDRFGESENHDEDEEGEGEGEGEGKGGEDPVLPAAFTALEQSGTLNLDRGRIHRWRFQAEALLLTPEGWTSPLVAITNDPLTPAQVILEGRDSEVREQPDGSLILTSASNRGLLENGLSVPLPRRINLRNNRPLWALLRDETRRNGFYVERLLTWVPPRSLGGGELTIRPQFMVERALSGKIASASPDRPSAEADPISVGDLFGLDVRYRRPTGPQGQFQLRTDLPTLSPRHLTSRMRAEASLQHPLTVPLLGETRATLNAAYQLSVWNGSLGEQDVYTAFGGFLEKDVQLPPWGPLRNRLLWKLGLQNINTTVFDTQDLSGKTWRASGYGRLTSTLPIWQGEILEDPEEALRYVPQPVRPEVALNTFLVAHSSSYGDHSGQRYYTLGMVSDVTMGHFSEPYLDYTKLSVGGSVSIVEQLSRFSFDRAVDLGLFHLSWTQQLAGPLVLTASASYNVDGASEQYGNRVDSVFELTWQRRAYGAGLFYSPERRLSGLRVSLNGFDWRGTGIPFLPYTPPS